MGAFSRQLGAESTTGAAMVLAIVREAAPVATALLIAGAGGSAMTASRECIRRECVKNVDTRACSATDGEWPSHSPPRLVYWPAPEWASHFVYSALLMRPSRLLSAYWKSFASSG